LVRAPVLGSGFVCCQLGADSREKRRDVFEDGGVVGFCAVAYVAVREDAFTGGGDLSEPLAMCVLDEMPGFACAGG
jgi:hypothetical protein